MITLLLLSIITIIILGLTLVFMLDLFLAVCIIQMIIKSFKRRRR